MTSSITLRPSLRVQLAVDDALLSTLLHVAIDAAGATVVDSEPCVVVTDRATGGFHTKSVLYLLDTVPLSNDLPHAQVTRREATWPSMLNAIASLAAECNIVGSETGRDPLTPRQLELLQLIADGCSTSQAARTIGITSKTVNNHLGAVYQRLGVENLTQAVLVGARRGLVSLR